MAFDPSGSRLIQGLDFVVYQSYDALLAAGADARANRDEDAGIPWLDDWSTANGPANAMGPGVGGSTPGGDGGTGGTPGPTRPGGGTGGLVRRVPPGGGGTQPNRRRPALVIRLTITADDQTKAAGVEFTWDGDEYTEAGLQ